MPNPAAASVSFSLAELARKLELDPPEGADIEVTGVAGMRAAGPHDLTFLANARYIQRLKDSRAGAVIVAQDYEGDAPMPMVRSAQPRIDFARAVTLFYPPPPRKVGVHPTAVVPESCTLGAEIYLGPYVVLGENVCIGDRSSVHAHTVLGDDVTVGEDTVVHSHVVLRDRVKLGNRVTLEDGVVLGANGFGFEPTAEGRLFPVPQVGTVEIGDDVDIQAGVCVDRAALGATTIGRGTKIDNLTQVGHGCAIGEDVVICGQVGLSGSTIVGDRVMIAGQVGFSGHTEVGNDARVVAKAGVMTDLEPGKVYVGAPAREYSIMMKALALQPRMPEFMHRLKKLERAFARSQAEDA